MYTDSEHNGACGSTDVATLAEQTRLAVTTLRNHLTALLADPAAVSEQARRDTYRIMAGEVDRLHGFLPTHAAAAGGVLGEMDCLLAEKAGEEPRLDVLVVEDSPGYACLLREAFGERNLAGRAFLVRDGEAALHFLRRQGSYAHAPRPGLVLLDWRLPRKDGREVLREIKADEALRALPVVVMSTSSYLVDIRAAYSLQASCYLVKPDDLSELVGVIRYVESVWRDGPATRWITDRSA